jgi:large subunit ribosomal protein L7/L12
MSNVNTDQIAEQLGQLSVMELIGLTKKLETAWGVSAAPAVNLAPPTPLPGTPVVAEQTEFEVALTGLAAPDKKISVIKVIREVTGLGLKEAKDLVEALPKTVKEGIAKAEAEDLTKKLREAGATVEMK